jgi:heavy metal sensor kinase
MAVGLAAASAALLWGNSRVMRQGLDHALAGTAFLVAEHLEPLTKAPRLEPTIATDPARYERDVNRYIVLRNVQGGVLQALPRFAADLPLDAEALAVARQGRATWVTGSWRGMPVRSLYVADTRAGSDGDRVIQIAASVHALRVVQRELLFALAAVVLLGSGATLVGAWQFAGSAVRPVEEITAQATRIEAGTLDQRIAAHAETDEYRGLVAVLNRMLERLEQGFRVQGRLTADMSHELRTPLTALRGEIEVALRAERSPQEYQRVLQSALEEIERLTTMSEDLLLITRAESRLMAPRRAPTDVNAVVRTVLDGLHRRIEEKGLTVEEWYDPAVGRLSLDQALIARLVGHLLDNAVKFTPSGGRVVVVAERVNGAVRLAVEDSGPGIDPADLPHVFEPFYRADPARSRGMGTGLGLALAAAVARLHGGAIHATNTPAGGARFEVDLPGATLH